MIGLFAGEGGLGFSGGGGWDCEAAASGGSLQWGVLASRGCFGDLQRGDEGGGLGGVFGKPGGGLWSLRQRRGARWPRCGGASGLGSYP